MLTHRLEPISLAATPSVVANKIEFDSANMHGRWITPTLYGVYSYHTVVLFFNQLDRDGNGLWHYNKQKFSPTSSKHLNLALDELMLSEVFGHPPGEFNQLKQTAIQNSYYKNNKDYNASK